jgi:protein involved in sex pheromone biosynthesis
MMRKAVAIAMLVAVSMLASCSNSVGTTEESDGLCKQTRSKQFIGITYTKSESFINCDNEN